MKLQDIIGEIIIVKIIIIDLIKNQIVSTINMITEEIENLNGMEKEMKKK